MKRDGVLAAPFAKRRQYGAPAGAVGERTCWGRSAGKRNLKAGQQKAVAREAMMPVDNVGHAGFRLDE